MQNKKNSFIFSIFSNQWYIIAYNLLFHLFEIVLNSTFGFFEEKER
jgi:hypothetical protein